MKTKNGKVLVSEGKKQEVVEQYPKLVTKTIVKAAEGVYVWRTGRFPHAAKCTKTGKDFVVYCPLSLRPNWLDNEALIEPSEFVKNFELPAEIAAANELLKASNEKPS